MRKIIFRLALIYRLTVLQMQSLSIDYLFFLKKKNFASGRVLSYFLQRYHVKGPDKQNQIQGTIRPILILVNILCKINRPCLFYTQNKFSKTNQIERPNIKPFLSPTPYFWQLFVKLIYQKKKIAASFYSCSNNNY